MFAFMCVTYSQIVENPTSCSDPEIFPSPQTEEDAARRGRIAPSRRPLAQTFQGCSALFTSQRLARTDNVSASIRTIAWNNIPYMMEFYSNFALRVPILRNRWPEPANVVTTRRTRCA